MKPNLNPIGALVLALILLTAASPSSLLANDESDVEVHQQRVHKIILNCDENSPEECEQEIRIESLGDDPHVMHVGGHDMVWVEAGESGAHHYSFASGQAAGGFLGVQLTDLTPELRNHFGVASEEGVMVAKVVDDSPAFRAGLAPGDIITRIDGEPVRSSSELSHVVRSREDGDTVDLEVWRDGAAETFSPALETRKSKARLHRRVMIDCDDEENCGAVFMGHGDPHNVAVDCPNDEDCRVEVDCRDGDCECTIDGDSVDCEDLHPEHGQDD